MIKILKISLKPCKFLSKWSETFKNIYLIMVDIQYDISFKCTT